MAIGEGARVRLREFTRPLLQGCGDVAAAMGILPINIGRHGSCRHHNGAGGMVRDAIKTKQDEQQLHRNPGSFGRERRKPLLLIPLTCTQTPSSTVLMLLRASSSRASCSSRSTSISSSLCATTSGVPATWRQCKKRKECETGDARCERG